MPQHLLDGSKDDDKSRAQPIQQFQLCGRKVGETDR